MFEKKKNTNNRRVVMLLSGEKKHSIDLINMHEPFSHRRLFAYVGDRLWWRVDLNAVRVTDNALAEWWVGFRYVCPVHDRPSYVNTSWAFHFFSRCNHGISNSTFHTFWAMLGEYISSGSRSDCCVRCGQRGVVLLEPLVASLGQRKKGDLRNLWGVEWM